MKYEVVIMHDADDDNERVYFDTLEEAVTFMEKEADAPCVCFKVEQEKDT